MGQFRDKDPIGNTSSMTPADKYRQDIHRDLDKIWNDAKEAAVTEGRLSKDEDFLRKRRELQMGPQARRAQLPQQQQQLSADVQNILDMYA